MFLPIILKEKSLETNSLELGIKHAWLRIEGVPELMFE